MTEQAREEKTKRIFAQTNEVFEIRTTKVTCGCRRIISIIFMFKCFYCGEYYCDECAPHHFGKTREEYRKEEALTEAGS